MKKLILFIPFIVLLVSASNDKEVTEKECIQKLADTSQLVRDEAAKMLLNIVRSGKTTYGPGNISEHDSSYWHSRISKADMRSELKDVVLSLNLDTLNQEIGMCLGQGCFNTYRLDNSYVLQLHYRSNPPHTVYFDTLIWQPKRINVEAPRHYSGEWRTYYVNGQLSHRVQYTDGHYNGSFISYHANGQVAYQQHYSNGSAEGEDRGYYYSGKLMYVGNYRNGKQDGEWIHYWENGNVKSKLHYKDGVHDGIDQEFFENGSLHTETTNVSGKQTRHRAFDKKGNCTFDSNNVR